MFIRREAVVRRLFIKGTDTLASSSFRVCFGIITFLRDVCRQLVPIHIRNLVRDGLCGFECDRNGRSKPRLLID